ncbi:hypothetical protein [Erythrobacter sp. CCH5-A1]|jgi:hypothetical protein|uniref:hypothetical protein n=1 Tax=Erythrobacter sp. CCH5-A1 TaxID=1768792 RepID=UPI000833C7EF|nr:hypothetical protein [Erythrobacter sp. CCH5-A1]
MKVKTLIPHMNGYGDKFEKAKGDEYDVPDVHAGPLIAAGLVEDPEARPPRPARRRSKKPASPPPVDPPSSDQAEAPAGGNDGAG